MRIIGHGVDIVEIARINEMLREHGERFIRRCFTAGEQGYAEAGQKRRAERYAGRFACKEAVLKALGTGWRSGIAWTDIEVLLEPSGRPFLRLGGRSAQIAGSLQILNWHVSMSHTQGHAIASVIGCG